MASTVRWLMSAAGLHPGGVVRWLEHVPEPRPGVYVVAMTSDPKSDTPTFDACPLSETALGELLATRPELTVDGDRPDPASLGTRLAAFWLPDEVVLYVGLAGTSLATRVDQYYRTRLGARSPHAGGWFLKTLGVLPDLWVHYAACDDPVEAEATMLTAFATEVSDRSRDRLHDAARPMPFANLESPKGVRKRHGIRGAKQPRGRSKHIRSASSTSERPSSPQPTKSAPATTPHVRTQPVTAADRRAGRIRVPRAAKRAFPSERADVRVDLRGRELDCRWDPRFGPPERSGVLGAGKAALTELVSEGEILRVEAVDGVIRLT